MSENNQAKKSVDVLFADGQTRVVRPLTIRKLRRFVVAVAELDKIKENNFDDETFNRMMDAAAIGLSDYPELAEDRDALEEAIDLEVFGEIMAVFMGTKVSDPNV